MKKKPSTPPSSEAPPKTHKELLKRLLKADKGTLGVADVTNVVEFILDTPRSLLDDPQLRYLMIDFLTYAETTGLTTELLERIKTLFMDITRESAKTDFYIFTKLMASVVLPNDFIDGRHIKKICEKLQEVAESIESPDPTKRAMIFMPPGSSKTLICSILFPAWLYGLHPNWHVIVVGYNDEFASDKIGHPLKELMGSAEYKDIFPDTKIRHDSKSKGRFVTTAKGEFKALGSRARAAGRRAHLLICDDTVSEKDAWSKTLRTEINNNYIGGLRSRLMRTPRGAEIIVNTRYHQEDVSGFLLKIDEESVRPWSVLSIPAVLDATASKLLREPNDPKGLYTEGTSFWPEMQPLELLMEERDTLMRTEPFKWNALYMQNPTPEEGSIIKFEDWQFWEKDKPPPRVTHVLVTMDTAFSEKTRADPSAYLVWGVFYPYEGAPPNLILLYGESGKWTWPELVEKCSQIRSDWKPDFMLIEKKASGQSLLQDLFRKGYPVVEYDPRGSKEERLHSASMWFKQARIWIPVEKAWAADIIEEICNFPSAAHDEFTDCASMAIIWYRDMGIVEHTVDLDPDELDDLARRSQQAPSSYWDSLIKLN